MCLSKKQINGNSTSKNRALQSAETALLNAEKDTLVTPFLYPDYLLSVVDDPTLALSDADLLEATNWQPCNDLLRSPKQRCRWPEGNDGPMVKYAYIDEADDIFRITVRVTGQGNSVVMLQSVYKR